MNKFSRLLLSATALCAAGSAVLAEPPASSTPATAKDNVVGISAQDGIVMSADGLLITRNGVTTRATKETVLDSGVKVLPDGTIIGTDGSHVMLRPDQVLTFDGKVTMSPPVAAPASGAAPVPAR